MCLSPKVLVKRFYEHSTSSRTKYMVVVMVMVMVVVVIIIEIKRTCAYSQVA